MPQLTYANTIFCTPTDVRNRLSSPEKVLVLTKDADTQYACTVTASLFTSTTATNFTAGQQVAFQTTGVLPSPLANGVGYYVVSTGLTATTFKVSTISGGPVLTITTAGTGTLSAYSSALNLAIQTKIELSKDIVRQELINYFQEKLPGRISSMLAFKRAQMNNMQSDFSRTLELLDRGTGSWNYPTYGYVTFEGLFYSVNNYQTFGQIPVLRVNYGAPTNGTSGTFAALAGNGDILADILGGNLYINREVDEPPVSPVWDLFLPADGIDYLLNPTELKHAMVSYTLMMMAADGTWRNLLQEDNPAAKEFHAYTTDFWEKQYKKDLNRGLSCVDVDISGNGLMNDWKRGITRSEVVVCG